MSLSAAQRRKLRAREALARQPARDRDLLGVVDGGDEAGVVAVAAGGATYRVTYRGTVPPPGTQVRISRRGPDYSLVEANRKNDDDDDTPTGLSLADVLAAIADHIDADEHLETGEVGVALAEAVEVALASANDRPLRPVFIAALIAG